MTAAIRTLIKKGDEPPVAHMRKTIAELEDILANERDQYPAERIRNFQEDLKWQKHVQGLWDELGGIPLNPETGYIDLDRTLETHFVAHDDDGETVLETFPVGTRYYDIWAWFGHTFGIDVAHELAGPDDDD